MYGFPTWRDAAALYHYTLSFTLCYTVSPKSLFAQSETHCAPETQTTQQTTRCEFQSGERSAETLPKRNYTANYTIRISRVQSGERSAETLPTRNYTANYTIRISRVQSGERSAETLPTRNYTANYTIRMDFTRAVRRVECGDATAKAKLHSKLHDHPDFTRAVLRAECGDAAQRETTQQTTRSGFQTCAPCPFVGEA